MLLVRPRAAPVSQECSLTWREQIVAITIVQVKTAENNFWVLCFYNGVHMFF